MRCDTLRQNATFSRFEPLDHSPGERIECDVGEIAVDYPTGRRKVDVLTAIAIGGMDGGAQNVLVVFKPAISERWNRNRLKAEQRCIIASVGR